MDGNLTDRKKKLVSKLSDAVRWSNERHILRLMKNPWNMLRIWSLKTKNRVEKIGVGTFWGGTMEIIWPERVSQFILRHGYFEADVCMYMITFLERGMTFVDIGAHFGFFSLLAGYLVQPEGIVLAFEPSRETYRHLNRNITSHCICTNTRTYNCAAYSENGEMEFHDYGLEDSAFNSMFESRDTKKPCTLEKTVLVQTRRVDDVLANEQVTQVSMVKIDAESAEMHVLAGLKQTLQSCKPKVILEVGDLGVSGVSASREAVVYLQQMGYRPFEVHKGEIAPHVVKDTYEYGNLLFLHD